MESAVLFLFLFFLATATTAPASEHMDQTTTTTEVTTPTTASHDVDTVAAAAASSTSSSTATSSATEQAVDGLLGAGLLPYAIRDTSSTRRRCANREMLVLMHRMLEGKKQGFYVDAGGAADHRYDTTRYDIAAREFSEETAATLYRLATATEASPSSTGDTAHQGDGDGSSMDIEAQAMSQEARVEASKAWYVLDCIDRSMMMMAHTSSTERGYMDHVVASWCGRT